jgi:hypothetical protein
MSKILIPPFELEIRSEDRIKILWNEGACERSLAEFKNLEHILLTEEKIYLLPSKSLLTNQRCLEWILRLTDYNQGIVDTPLVKSFFTEKMFDSEIKQSFGYGTVVKWFNKVENLIMKKNKFDG